MRYDLVFNDKMLAQDGIRAVGQELKVKNRIDDVDTLTGKDLAISIVLYRMGIEDFRRLVESRKRKT